MKCPAENGSRRDTKMSGRHGWIGSFVPLDIPNSVKKQLDLLVVEVCNAQIPSMLAYAGSSIKKNALLKTSWSKETQYNLLTIRMPFPKGKAGHGPQSGEKTRLRRQNMHWPINFGCTVGRRFAFNLRWWCNNKKELKKVWPACFDWKISSFWWFRPKKRGQKVLQVYTYMCMAMMLQLIRCIVVRLCCFASSLFTGRGKAYFQQKQGGFRDSKLIFDPGTLPITIEKTRLIPHNWKS